MPATFSRFGVEFQYPENWTLDMSEAGLDAVTLYSPGGGMWSVAVHPPTSDLKKLCDAALSAMEQEYAAVESEPVGEELAGYRLAGYDLNFFYVDLTSTAAIRAYHTPSANYLMMWQAEDRDFAALEQVFQAITLSLLQSSR
jgi:hypothetical protein